MHDHCHVIVDGGRVKGYMTTSSVSINFSEFVLRGGRTTIKGLIAPSSSVYRSYVSWDGPLAQGTCKVHKGFKYIQLEKSKKNP